MDFLQKVKSTYRLLSKITPSPIVNEEGVIARHTQRNFQEKSFISYMTNYTLEDGKFKQVSFPYQLENIKIIAPSPSGNLMALVKSKKSDNNENEDIIEIWDHGSLRNSISTKNTNQQIITDPTFKTFEWSKDESKILYVAEPKRVKSIGYLDSIDDKNPPESIGEEFKYREEWGEQLVGISIPRPFLVNLSEDPPVVRAIKGISDEISVGQACFSSDDNNHIVFVGYHHKPRRYGLKHCCNRYSSLYVMDISENKIKKGNTTSSSSPSSSTTTSAVNNNNNNVSDDDDSIDIGHEPEMLISNEKFVHFPQFSPDKSLLAYFTHDYCITHQTAFKLNIMDWKSRSSKTIVDVVDKPKSIDSFPGIYLCAYLPREIFTSDNKYIILNSEWRSSYDMIRIDIETGEIINLSKHNEENCTVLSIDNNVINGSNRILVSVSNPHHPPYLEIRSVNGETLYSMNDKVIEPKECNEILNSFSYEVLEVNPRDNRSNDFSEQFECILYTPKNKINNNTTSTCSTPLLVLPHGGPNSANCIGYSFQLPQWIEMGYSVLSVNYRGSVGFGNYLLNSLQGNIGIKDVHDIEDAISLVINRKDSVIDKSKLMICGGSHGGFLAGHLIGQQPDMFKAAVLECAVLNIASQVSTSDIIDWCIGQSTGDYKLDKLRGYSGEEYEKMRKCSPIAYIENVKTPALILSGMVDQRVPYSNVLEYYNILRNRGVDTEFYLYPKDCHNLDEFGTSIDCFFHIAEWFHKYI